MPEEPYCLLFYQNEVHNSQKCRNLGLSGAFVRLLDFYGDIRLSMSNFIVPVLIVTA